MYDANSGEPILSHIIDDKPLTYTAEYVTDREVNIRVRNGGPTPIKSINIPATITESGLTVPIIRISDA